MQQSPYFFCSFLIILWRLKKQSITLLHKPTALAYNKLRIIFMEKGYITHFYWKKNIYDPAFEISIMLSSLFSSSHGFGKGDGVSPV
mmetsp:Transcript_29366/g.44817  ORF Transcript_29366/g.44817 Transcript_29366/m.44817 type:complete len:87 (+) Transcript_29366:91-351(+)